MSIPETFVATFRTLRADRYIDSCVITRVTGTTFNDTTGQTENATTQVYSGECLVRPASAREAEYGQDERQEVDYDLYLPYDSADLENGDEVTVTSGLDPDIPVLSVLRGFQDSYLTRRHYETKAVTDA